MHRPLLALALLTVVGCSGESAFDHRTEVFVPAQGVVLDEDGDEGVAGMFGTTCRFDAVWGALGTDYDVEETEDEAVVDINRSPEAGDTGEFLVVSSVGAHVFALDDWEEGPSWQLISSGVVGGGFADTGVVLAIDGANGCSVDFPQSLVELGQCTVSATALDAAESGTMFLGTDAGLLAVTPDGASLVDGGSYDHLAFDAGSSMLYAASGPTLVAFDASGSLVWTQELRGDVVALDSLGATGAAVAMVANPGGSGSLLVLDGETGSERANLSTPSPADEVATSVDGSTVALVVPNQIHVFDLALD